MKKFYLTFVLILIMQYANSQSNSFAKFKGIWDIESAGFNFDTLSKIEITATGVKWFYNQEAFDMNGEPLLFLAECNLDSIIEIIETKITLRDTTFNAIYNDFGETQIVKAKTYKNRVVYTTNIAVDNFVFITNCEIDGTKVEINFYSENEGFIFINRKGVVSINRIFKTN